MAGSAGSSDGAGAPDSLLGKVRMVEVGPANAGTICGSLLADFGAEVIRVDRPGHADAPAVMWPGSYVKDGIPLVQKVRNRNKLMVTLDLSTTAAHAIFRRLVERSDVLMENFRPGRLEGWGLDVPTLHAWNPRLVICRLSAFGQTGPYRDRPGEGRIAEAFGGHAYLNGEPDGAPLHSQMDMGGSLAGSWSAMAIMMALYWRDARDGTGQVIDVAAWEPIFRQIQQQIISNVRNGAPEKRAGNRKANRSPWVASHVTADNRHFTYSAATRVTMRDQQAAMNLDADPRFDSVESVEKRREEYYQAATEWMAAHTLAEVERAFASTAAAGTPVQSAAELLTDEHVRARQLVVEVADPDLGTVRMPGVVPSFSANPGHVRQAGQPPGTHNVAVYSGVLGLAADEIAALTDSGVI